MRLGGRASVTCRFYPRVAAPTLVSADPPEIHQHVCWDVKQPTNTVVTQTKQLGSFQYPLPLPLLSLTSKLPERKQASNTTSSSSTTFLSANGPPTERVRPVQINTDSLQQAPVGLFNNPSRTRPTAPLSTRTASHSNPSFSSSSSSTLS